MFADYLARWKLLPDGEPIRTSTSRLLPVRSARYGSAMLKVAVVEEEARAGRLLGWWAGQGAVRVLARTGAATLMERARNQGSLAELARDGRDDEASRIICATVASLHAVRSKPPPHLTPLARWFEPLEPAARDHGGVWRVCASVAAGLLARPQDPGVLHGDIHHRNILDFGPRGWLAIDPKGLRGEQTFDYANLFCNPDPVTAGTPARLGRRLDVVAAAAGLERWRLLDWVIAWSGLSAAFLLQDGQPPAEALRIAELAVAERSR